MSERKKDPAEDTSDREIVISRVFNATRELVWKAWTDPKHVVNWWGPKGFTTTIEVMDVRPGGMWNHVMHGPDGTNFPNRSIFKEVVRPERIVFSNAGEKEGGPGILFESTWTFEEKGKNKTEVTIRMVFETRQGRELVVKEFGAVEGGKQTLGRLAEYLPQATPAATDKDLVFTRVFNATRDLVWKAWTEPQHLQHWWGPKGFTNPVCRWDYQSGGAIYVEMRSPDGISHPMTGTTRQAVKPERLVFTAGATDEDGRQLFEVLNTVTLEVHEKNKTKLALLVQVLWATPQAAKHLGGANEGWSQSLVRLEELLNSQPRGDN